MKKILAALALLGALLTTSAPAQAATYPVKIKAVPSVAAMTQGEAWRVLSLNGFRNVSFTIQQSKPPSVPIVIYQDPPAGTVVPITTRVDLWLR